MTTFGRKNKSAEVKLPRVRKIMIDTLGVDYSDEFLMDLYQLMVMEAALDEFRCDPVEWNKLHEAYDFDLTDLEDK